MVSRIHGTVSLHGVGNSTEVLDVGAINLTRAVTNPDKVAREVVVLGPVLARNGCRRVATHAGGGARLGGSTRASRGLREGVGRSSSASQAGEGLLKLEKQRLVTDGSE